MLLVKLILLVLLSCVAILQSTAEPVAYRIGVGSQVGVDNMLSNFTYNTLGSAVGSTPVNFTLTLFDGALMVPIFYSDVYYLLYNVATNLTDTHYISYCDPVPNRDQGNISYSERGHPICPTIYECIVTELAPSEYYDEWPDLRCCLLNYTIIDRTDIPALQPGSTMVAKPMVVDMVLNQPPVTPTANLGLVDCNDFIARSLNCQWARQLNTYVEQCQASPIPCYSRGIGKWFGAFWDQNPLYQYTLPRANWTEAHWRGIASTLNNLVYYKDGQLTDPLTPLILDDYFWIANLTSLQAASQEVLVDASWVFPDYIQAQPYSWIAGSYPPPPTEFFLDYDSPQFIPTIECIFFYTPDCVYRDWTNVTEFSFRYPGFMIPLNVNNIAIIYSLIFTPFYTIYGAELIDGNGVSCGKYMEEIQAGQNLTFYCSSGVAPANSTAHLILYFPFFIWDVVGKGLAPGVEAYDDPLVPFLDYVDFEDYQYLATLAGILMSSYALDNNELSIIKNLPSRINPEAVNIRTGWAGNLLINFTVDVGQGQFIYELNSVKANIRQNNIYPHNTALANSTLFRGLETAAVNLTDPDHQEWLWGIWSTWYAPRQAGSETGQCATFNLGDTVYPDVAPKQFWYNGQPQDPGYDVPAGTLEGGCLCNASLPARLDPQFFCSKCQSGFGPQDQTDWSLILQSDQVLAGVLNTSSYPAGLSLTSWTSQQFQDYLLCRFPVTPDPVIGSLAPVSVCSGHGVLTYTETVDQVDILEQYLLPAAVWTVTLCSELFLQWNSSYSETLVQYQTGDPLSLLYYNQASGTVVTILEGSAVYVNGQVVSYTASPDQPLNLAYPPFGSVSNSELDGLALGCLNENFFLGGEGLLFNHGGQLNRFRTWLGYFTL